MTRSGCGPSSTELVSSSKPSRSEADRQFGPVRQTSSCLHKESVCWLQGAEAPLSGLVALLAAAEVLGNASAATNYTRRLVFAALAGEPWGLMGSRRLLWQMHAGHASTRGLSLIDIEQVRHACVRLM